MTRNIPFIFTMLLAGFGIIASSGAALAADTKQLESHQMGIVITVPDGWKVADQKDAPPTAVSEDGSVRLVMIYFPKLYLFEVLNSEKLPTNFAPALKDAKQIDGDKTVINGLAGETANGAGTRDDKPVQFKSVLIGDKDNQPNTLAFIIVASEEAMKQHAKEIKTALESIRAKDAN